MLKKRLFCENNTHCKELGVGISPLVEVDSLSVAYFRASRYSSQNCQY